MEKSENSLKKIKKYFTIHIIFIFPSILLISISHICDILKIQTSVWNPHSILLLLTFPMMLARFLFIPYILSFILCLLYIRTLKKLKFPRKETILFIIFICTCIFGLFTQELVFIACMGI